MSLSYPEKSIWASLISTIIIFGFYFVKSFQVLRDPAIPDIAIVYYFVGVVAASVIVQIVFQSTLAIMHRKAAKAGNDERDNAIKMRSTQYSYYVLVFGIWASVAAMLFNFSIILLINLVILSFIVAEVVSFITTLVHYRRGY